MSKEPDLVSRDRILRLRLVMPDESPIDLDAHAAMIAYDVERVGSLHESMRRHETHIAVTQDYVQDMHRFLDEIRHALEANRPDLPVSLRR